MDYHFREAEVTDLQAICDLSYEFTKYENEKYDDRTYDKNWGRNSDGREFYASKIVSDNAQVLVAEVDGELIGYLVGVVKDISWRLPKKTGEILNLYVKKGHRNNGVGAEMTKRFTEFAKGKKAARITLMQHFENDQALRFYKRAGFAEHAFTLSMDLD